MGVVPIDKLDLGLALAIIAVLGSGFVFVWANVRTTTLGESIRGLVALNNAQKGEIENLRGQVEQWREKYEQLNASWEAKYERLKCEFEAFKASVGRRTMRGQ